MSRPVSRLILSIIVVVLTQIVAVTAIAAPMGQVHVPRAWTSNQWVTHFWEDGTELNNWIQDGDNNHWRFKTTEGEEALRDYWRGNPRNQWINDPHCMPSNYVFAVDTGRLAAGDSIDWIWTSFTDSVSRRIYPWYIHYDVGFFYDTPNPFTWYQVIITPNRWFWEVYGQQAGRGWTGWKHMGVNWREWPQETGKWYIMAGVYMPRLTATTVLFDNMLIEEDPPITNLPQELRYLRSMYHYSPSKDKISGPGSTGPGDPNEIVPEPCTLFLLCSGLAGIAGFGRKRLFKKA